MNNTEAIILAGDGNAFKSCCSRSTQMYGTGKRKAFHWFGAGFIFTAGRNKVYFVARL